MDEHGASCVLQLSNAPFGNAILVVRIHSSKGNCLVVLVAMVDPGICLEDPIINVICSNLYPVS